MPSKESYLVFFLVIAGLLVLLQWFIYHRFAKIVRRDFPDRAERFLKVSRWIFFAMNLPIVFLFFRRQIHAELPTLTNIILIPFTVWQGLIVVWTLVLFPIAAYEFMRNRIRNFARPHP